MNRLELFLNELTELTQKYGIKICGCGCCGSPWLSDEKNEFDTDNLKYNHKKRQYEVPFERR